METMSVALASAMHVDLEYASGAMQTGMDYERKIAGLKDTSMTVTGTYDEASAAVVRHLTIRTRHLIFRGRKYTVQQFSNWCENEIFRKGTRPVIRTTSPRFRAGTRRTKRYARATR